MIQPLFDVEMELTAPEAARRDYLETVIDRGQKTFIETGAALLEMRDRRFYRETHKTFDGYLAERWPEIGRARAYQLMDGAAVVENLSTIVDILPTNEAQARPLTRLEPADQPAAWRAAVETAPNGKVTAAHVEQVVRQIQRPAPMAVHYSSETPEHYTPPAIIQSVVRVLGRIDLDPCSNSKTAPNVPAAAHYTASDNGLAQPWRGAVYMNPPYGRQIGDWVEKLCAAYEAGQISAAIALAPARTDTQWWQRLNAGRGLVCFVSGRLVFIGNEQSAPFPSAVVYLGHDEELFCKEFGHHGQIYRRL